MRSLLVFALGPVQGFIATARRGRDLWFGSWLLSELARAAAKAAHEHDSAALISPSSASLTDPEASFSNKLLVDVDGDPAEIAARMLEAATVRLLHLADATFDDLKRQGAPFRRDVARRQIATALEHAWASASLDGRSFGEARSLAEHLLAARKTTRPFADPPPVHEHKSTLNPALDAVTERRPREVRERPGPLRMAPGERLDGVSLLKRHGAEHGTERHQRVLSTSHVAAWPLRERLERLAEDPAVRQQLRDALSAARRRWTAVGAELSRTPDDDAVLGNLDGHTLYRSRLHDLLPDEDGLDAARAALDELYRAWTEIAEARGEPPLRPPGPYFAVLQADGDRVGAALDELTDADHHRQVAEALDRFATTARALVRDHHGHCVYAGGDDVLALLPVTTALPCARALAHAFAADVGKTFADLTANGSEPTLSAGVCVAHHIDPLARALEGAHQAERAAKDLDRDAWCVRVQKRSGGTLSASGKWARYEAFHELIKAVAGDDGIPRGLPHDLLTVAKSLPDHRELAMLEVERVLAQKAVAADARDAVKAWIDDEELPSAAEAIVVARALTGMEVA